MRNLDRMNEARLREVWGVHALPRQGGGSRPKMPLGPYAEMREMPATPAPHIFRLVREPIGFAAVLSAAGHTPHVPLRSAVSPQHAPIDIRPGVSPDASGPFLLRDDGIMIAIVIRPRRGSSTPPVKVHNGALKCERRLPI